MPVQELRDGGITVVTVDRPEAHNAVDHETAVALAEAIERFGADDDAAVLVLTGAGPASFCAGADLKSIPELLGDDEFCTRVGPMGFAKLDPGVRIDATRARELGFVQEIVPTGRALERAVELGRYIAGYPQAGLRSDRAAVHASTHTSGRDLLGVLALEDDARRASLSDGVMLDRLRAFACGERPTPPSAS